MSSEMVVVFGRSWDKYIHDLTGQPPVDPIFAHSGLCFPPTLIIIIIVTTREKKNGREILETSMKLDSRR